MNPAAPRSAAPRAPRLSRLERLRRASSFERAFRRGRCFRDPQLRVHFIESPTGRARLGLVVSRKVGGAVERNLVKRRLRHAWRELKHRLPRPLDVVLLAEPRAPRRGFGDYRAAIERFLSWLAKDPRAGRGGRAPP